MLVPLEKSFIATVSNSGTEINSNTNCKAANSLRLTFFIGSFLSPF
nr:MAG TPA: hypothetical protein [Caudoviricetes sp.]